MGTPERRAELLGWIAASRRLQFRLGIALSIAAVIAIVVTVIDKTIGGISLAMLAIISVCAFWVTGSHILDWRNRLEALDQAERAARNAAAQKRNA